MYDSLDVGMDLNRNLNIAIDAALKGGLSIMEVYDGDDFQIEKKADDLLEGNWTGLGHRPGFLDSYQILTFFEILHSLDPKPAILHNFD